MEESSRAVIGAAILIALLVFSNLIVYAAARGATRGRKRPTFFKAAQDLFRNPNRKDNDPMDELRKKVEELEGKRKEHLS